MKELFYPEYPTWMMYLTLVAWPVGFLLGFVWG